MKKNYQTPEIVTVMLHPSRHLLEDIVSGDSTSGGEGEEVRGHRSNTVDWDEW